VNARDAMPRGGTLTIETSTCAADRDFIRANPGAIDGEYARLTITDTGTGMTAEVKAHLFEPFFTTKEQGKGTGLGLATCFGIVKQSNGFIAARSELGRGTTFDVFLPMIQHEIEPAEPRDRPRTSALGSEAVLLVEDDVSVRRLAARVLRAQGYEVLEASDGEEGLSAVKADADKRLRLVITDVVMPKLGGKQLADAVGRARPDVKIIFTTGYTEDVMLTKGVVGEGHVMLRKPFILQDLVEKVREMLDA
jgi:CheY-like chemotaxis protein